MVIIYWLYLKISNQFKIKWRYFITRYKIHYIIVYTGTRSSNQCQLNPSTRFLVGIFKVQQMSVFSDSIDAVSIQIDNVLKCLIYPLLGCQANWGRAWSAGCCPCSRLWLCCLYTSHVVCCQWRAPQCAVCTCSWLTGCPPSVHPCLAVGQPVTWAVGWIPSSE